MGSLYTYIYFTTVHIIADADSHFSAKCDGFDTSNDIFITAYSVSEDAEIQMIEKVNEIERIAEVYEEDGYIKNTYDLETVLHEVEKYGETLKEKGDVIEVHNNGSNIVLRFSNGFWYAYLPPIEGVAEGYIDGTISVRTAQPFYNNDFPENHNDIIDESASYIKNADNYFDFDTNLDDSDVTLDFVKNFGVNQIVLWEGHGGYDEELGPFICTGEAYEDITMSEMKVDGEIIMANNGRACFTSSFVESKLGDLSNSIIFLGCCQSGYDDRLLKSFYDKNAAFCLGFSDITSIEYDTKCIEAFAHNIVARDENGEYPTVMYAINNIYNDIGMKDPLYGKLITNGKKAAVLKGYGNYDFNLGRIKKNLENIDLADIYMDSCSNGTYFPDVSSDFIDYEPFDFFTTEDFIEHGKINGIPSVDYLTMDMGKVTLYENIDGVTIRGIHPGQTMEEANMAILQAGYVSAPWGENIFISGSGRIRYVISIIFNNDIVESVSIMYDNQDAG